MQTCPKDKYFPAEHKIAPEEVADGLVDPDIDGVFVDETDELAVGLDDEVLVDEPDELVVGLDDRVGTALSGSVDEGVGDVDTVNDDLALDEDVIVGLAVAEVELDEVAVDEAVDDEDKDALDEGEEVTVVLGEDDDDFVPEAVSVTLAELDVVADDETVAVGDGSVHPVRVGLLFVPSGHLPAHVG